MKRDLPSPTKMPASLSRLYARPGFLLRRAHQISAAVFEDACREPSITPAQFGVLTVLQAHPGMGQSSPQKARSYSGWADDLVAIADALGYREFGVTGWSEGGPWALAAAAYIDTSRLRHVSSIAPGSYGAFGDNSAAQYLSKIDALGGTLALRFTPGFRLMYANLGLLAKRFPQSFVKQVRNQLSEYDQQILLRPDVATTFGDACAECFAHGSDGLVRDAELLYRRWAFDVAAIQRPVHIWQGLDDKLVPDPINKAVADAMPGAVWHPVEGAGHFVAVGKGDDIFAIAAAEL